MKRDFMQVWAINKGPESFSYVHVLFRLIYLATASKSQKGVDLRRWKCTPREWEDSECERTWMSVKDTSTEAVRWFWLFFITRFLFLVPSVSTNNPPFQQEADSDLLLSPRQLRLRPRPQPTFPVICAGGTHLQQRPIYHFVLGLCQKYCGHVIVYHQWMGGGGVQRWLSFSMRTRICLVYPRWLHGLYFGFSAVFWSQTLLSSALCQFPMLGSKFIFRHQN